MDKRGIQNCHAFDLERDNDPELNGMTEENVPILLRKAIQIKNFKEDCSKLEMSNDNSKRKSKRKNQPSRSIVKYHCYENSTDFENGQLLKVHSYDSVTCSYSVPTDSVLEIKQEPESDNESKLHSIDIIDQNDKVPVDKYGKKSDFHSIDQNDKVDKIYGKKFICSMCGKRFKWENGLKGHLKTHHDQNLFTCVKCPKSFITKADCIEHVKIHSEEKPYVCDVCGRRYVLRESLTRHYRVHDTKTAYTCHVCGKAFAENISFKRHQTIHTGK